MSNESCRNCGEPHDPGAVFCEACGYDFLTGSLPDPEPSVTSIAGAENPPNAEPSSPATLSITVDPAYHHRTDTDDVLDLPDPLPEPVVVALLGEQVLIGRSRPSRGLFPDVDLTADPAVSSRHARLERDGDTWTITDLGSTNGTYVGDSTVAIEPDLAVRVTPGTAIHVGAWTRLEIVTP